MHSFRFMPDTDSYIISGNIKLHYHKVGEGTKSMLVFHGFGMELYSMVDFKICFPEHTLYFFDLFFHGKSQWSDSKQPLTVEKWNVLIDRFLQKENIDRFEMFGFSIGAKSLLAVLSKFAPKVDSILLIAPDGIVQKFWYSLATGTKVGQLLFRKLMENPVFIMKCLNWIKGSKLLPNKLIVFVRSQLAAQTNRIKVYHTWMVYRKLRLSEKKIANLITDHTIATTIVAGNQDSLFPPNSFNNFVRLIPGIKLLVLEAGHRHMIDKTLKFLIQNR
jgi:pimeloyl-ACP methyl ester carboxylesterase